MVKRVLSFLATTLCCVLPSAAEVSLPALLADHMVVQRRVPVHLWGRAAPGERVTVSFRDESRSVVADELGRWSLHLPPGEAGGPFEIGLEAANTLRLRDVWVGDVWMASGQSNMEWPLERTEGAADEISRASHPEIRSFRVEKKTSAYPLEDVSAAGWTPCSAETAAGISAVAYFFALDVRLRQKVPIGLIDASWGGTPLAAFTSLTAIAQDPSLMPAIANWADMADAQATTLLVSEKEKREHEVAAAAAEAEGRAAPSLPWRPQFEAWAPAAIYNGMIAPVTAFPIRGVIWYQGESDASPERAPVYGPLFRTMIQDWRRAWGVGDLPFLFVQLANWRAGAGNAWPELREAQTQALWLANTSMAVIIDVGDPADIHPRDKKTVGARLALAARALAYGESLEHSGPLFRLAVPEGGSLRVFFDHAGGLATSDGEAPRGFEIAGADGAYSKADARIEGSTVVVSSSEISAPRKVRYGWADDPEVNLSNGAGLPASPFRSER